MRAAGRIRESICLLAKRLSASCAKLAGSAVPTIGCSACRPHSLCQHAFPDKKDPWLVNSIAPPFIKRTAGKNKGRGRHKTAEHLPTGKATVGIVCETDRLRRPHNRVQCLQAARRNPREYLRSDKIISGDACGTENLCIAAIRIQPSAGAAAGGA